MKSEISISSDNRKYINAFVEVANILEPNVKFNDVIYQKHSKDNGVDVVIAVSGKTKSGTIVTVTNELRDVMKGEEIVVRYVNPTTMKTIKERGVWACSFNWTALMATCDCDR